MLLYFLTCNAMNEKQEKRKAYMQEYLAEYRKKTREIKITLSNKDYELIKRIAEKQGLKTSAYIRIAAMEQSKNLYLFPKDIEEQITLAVRNMRGIGNNINQIARYCNEQKFSCTDYLENGFNLIKIIEKEIKNLRLPIYCKKCKKKHFIS